MVRESAFREQISFPWHRFHMTSNSSAATIDRSNFGKFFIGGDWVDPSTDRVIEVVSPTTEEAVFRVAEAAEADVDRAVAAARAAFDDGPWPGLSPAERADYLRELAQQLRTRQRRPCEGLDGTGRRDLLIFPGLAGVLSQHAGCVRESCLQL